MVRGLDKGELHCKSEKRPNADKWKRSPSAPRNQKTKVEGLKPQLVVRHVQAHVTGESKKHMKDKIMFNTEGNRKSDEEAKWVLI